MSLFPQGSFFGVSMMGQSLDAFQQAENVTSNNIANVNTPGASRQEADLAEATPITGSPFYAAHTGGTFGQGAVVSQIQRIHADEYDGLFRGASSSQNFFQTQQSALQTVQSSLGDPNSGIGVQFNSFQAAIAQLVNQASSGQSSSVRQNVLTQAQALTASLNSSSSVLSQQESLALGQGQALVTKVNGILDQMAQLNGQIRASSAAGDSPNTFQDQRDYLIDQLSQYISTQTSIQSDGSVYVAVNGQAMVDDTVTYHLAGPSVGTAANGAPTFKVDFASNPPAAASAPGVPLGSGQLAALQDLYNNKYVAYGQQLDQFASSLANETNRITQASYDQNGAAGTALFQPIVAALPITAGNIKVGITNPAELPVALASTQTGTLVQPLNSANNTVDTSSLVDGNTSFANAPAADAAGPPPTGGTQGALTINVNGISQTFNYDTNSLNPATANATTINQFVANFNNGHFGVTASFDASSQRIVFTRDPSNEDLVLRGAQQNNAETPSFTITDTPAGGAGILSALGATGINGVQQNATNAYATNDNSGANAMVKMFQANVGIPALEMTAAAATTAGTLTTVALPSGVNNIQVGQVLTLDARANGAVPQENVVVTAVSYNPTTGVESVQFTPSQNHALGYTIASAQQKTLNQFYGSVITQVGIDTQTAITGASSQATLASNIDQVRQSISGINIDEETQNLIKYQNAYAATARTISVLNQLLGTVINGLGVGG